MRLHGLFVAAIGLSSVLVDARPRSNINLARTGDAPSTIAVHDYTTKSIKRQDVNTTDPASAFPGTKNPEASIPAATFPGTSAYWLSTVKRQGTVAFGNNTAYKIFRNVKDYGARGDGSADDTEAINKAVSDGNRCGSGCDSSTITPALVYFPPGTYMVSKPIIQYYYTQFVGDAVTPPTLKAMPTFEGIAVIDADPYEYVDGVAVNWYTNQNNFFRQVRNFVIDLTAISAKTGAGIHWQVSQATSLQNIRFEMIKGDSQQSGLFIDNGSGGFMSDLTFNGGNIGAFVGSQQFTSRNITFNDCNTAIFMNWNWLWAWKSVAINNCKVGLDMANGPTNQTVGSVLLQDSTITNTPVGVNSSFSADSIPRGGGTLIIDNVDFTGTPTAVQSFNGQVVLPGGKVIDSWGQGQFYAGSVGSRQQGAVDAATKPQSLLTSSGRVFERSKPQYETIPASQFISVKGAGARGDGQTDDTTAVQNAFNNLKEDQVLYFDHGAYIIKQTINIPGNRTVMVTGETWPLIMANGDFFGDETNPKPVFSIGQPGDKGAVEISDLIFETSGPAPGAIMMQWNSDAVTQGSNGVWDTHFRIGGSAGTQLQSDQCSKTPQETTAPNPACIGAHTLFSTTPTASVYLENTWFWVADHELDRADHTQVNIYNGRGVSLESTNAVWLYGTSSEHSVLYQYQLNKAQNVYMSVIQSESPYFQANPAAPAPFKVQAADPQFNGAANGANKAWGLRVVDSSNVLVYGAGLYSFFENYGQTCVPTQNCQDGMVSIEGTTQNLSLYGLSTKAAVNMVSTTGYIVGASNSTGVSRAVTNLMVPDADNRSNFCATLALWRPE
jgi:glucan 1,3-beta-glucosidase